jgi:hypothetical protein
MGVSVGVKVNVGNGVSDGWGVMVSVEVKVGWMVAGSVGEGSGLVVQVGSRVGVGVGWISVSPPHPIDKYVIARRTKV